MTKIIMEYNLVSPEVAYFLKKKNYCTPTQNYYNSKGELNGDGPIHQRHKLRYDIPINWNACGDNCTSAPSWSETQDWLRSRYEIHIVIFPNGNVGYEKGKITESLSYGYHIYHNSLNSPIEMAISGKKISYELALKGAVMSAMDILDNL